ncbi:hypothetical protein [Streptomyces chartreusis]|uniref:hypothetical protein n=1 Tax=Streptomyces chartreusis TaxID=1969 RepID=UPI0036427202
MPKEVNRFRLQPRGELNAAIVCLQVYNQADPQLRAYVADGRVEPARGEHAEDVVRVLGLAARRGSQRGGCSTRMTSHDDRVPGSC